MTSADTTEAAPERGAAAEILSRRRMFLVLAALLAEIGLFAAGLLTPLPDATRQALANQASSQFGGVQNRSAVQLVGFIFSHNAAIAIPEMIPVLGALLFVVSVFSTGLAAQALVASQGLPASWGALIFAFPYTVVELTAYAVALVSGFMLLVAWRKKRLRRELKFFALEGLGVLAILVVAATMEVITVKVSPASGFALWLPTGLALAGVLVFAGRRWE